jgi:hypothetical protein
MTAQLLDLWKTSIFFRISSIVVGVGALMIVLTPRSGTVTSPMTSQPAASPILPPAAGLGSAPPLDDLGVPRKLGRILQDSYDVAGSAVKTGKAVIDGAIRP